MHKTNRTEVGKQDEVVHDIRAVYNDWEAEPNIDSTFIRGPCPTVHTRSYAGSQNRSFRAGDGQGDCPAAGEAVAGEAHTIAKTLATGFSGDMPYTRNQEGPLGQVIERRSTSIIQLVATKHTSESRMSKKEK